MAKAYSIVGTQFTGIGEAFMAELKPGTPATLVREPTNQFDPNAIAVWIEGKRIGYIPKNQNKILSAFIDQQGVAWVPPPGEGTMALDSGREVRPCIEARFIRSPNSNFPMVEV